MVMGEVRCMLMVSVKKSIMPTMLMMTTKWMTMASMLMSSKSVSSFSSGNSPVQEGKGGYEMLTISDQQAGKAWSTLRGS